MTPSPATLMTRSPASPRPRPRRRGRSSPYSTYLLPVACAVLALCVSTRFGFGWHWPYAYLVAVNLVTAGLYGWDKRRSRSAGPRVPENTLHAAALAGGTPAAWVSQRLFHHKTAKRPFQLRFWIIAVVQAVAVVAWYAWHR
ncbi:MAG: Cold-shock DNA-binding domain protein [Phycisphaerales bacterium]|nr:Cold-shock DNA-binding domain protein [Phycisphaerales bacterium]